MTYEEMFAKASKLLNKAKVKDVADHIAIQFNVDGDGCGIFYAEINEGAMNVQPYDYNDKDIEVTVDSAELFKALENKAGDTLAFVGNEEKIAVIKPILAKIPKARAAAAKKAPAEKSETKTAAKKAPAKKTAAKKTTEK